jgi:hypothetical protein
MRLSASLSDDDLAVLSQQLDKPEAMSTRSVSTAIGIDAVGVPIPDRDTADVDVLADAAVECGATTLLVAQAVVQDQNRPVTLPATRSAPFKVCGDGKSDLAGPLSKLGAKVPDAPDTRQCLAVRTCRGPTRAPEQNTPLDQYSFPTVLKGYAVEL